MRQVKNAFTLIELMTVLLFLAAFAYIAVIRVPTALLDNYKSGTFAKKLITDMRLARSMAITDAAGNNTGFVVVMLGSQPYRNYEIRNDANDAVVSSFSIDPKISCTGGSNFHFGPLGNLVSGSGTQLNISAAGKTSTITIVAATGSIKCEN